MSGPKVDTAEIRSQERRLIEAARQGRKNLASSIRSMMNSVNESIGDDLKPFVNDDLCKSNFDKILELQDIYSNKLKELLNKVKIGNERLNIEEIKASANQIVQQFNIEMKKELSTVYSIVKSSESYKKLEYKTRELENIKKKKIARLTDEDRSSDVDITDDLVNELVDSFNEEFNEFMQDENLTSKHKNSMLHIVQELGEIMSSPIAIDRKEKKVKKLFSEFQSMSSFINNEISDMKLYYEEYQKECFDMPITTKKLSDFSSKKEIQEEIEYIQSTNKSVIEKEYIKRQIDEVMAKHGYDIVRSDVLSDMSENGQILYGVDNSTAINVFVSDENQVTMRVVGVGFDTNISEEEDEKLFQQQCAFCSLHPQITKELEMRGVLLKTKKHLPPDKKYNKKIQTNISNTNNTNKTTSRAKKELKRTELKAMHKE